MSPTIAPASPAAAVTQSVAVAPLSTVRRSPILQNTAPYATCFWADRRRETIDAHYCLSSCPYHCRTCVGHHDNRCVCPEMRTQLNFRAWQSSRLMCVTGSMRGAALATSRIRTWLTTAGIRSLLCTAPAAASERRGSAAWNWSPASCITSRHITPRLVIPAYIVIRQRRPTRPTGRTSAQRWCVGLNLNESRKIRIFDWSRS